MVELLTEAFSPAFMQRALIGGLLAGLVTSLVGTWVVLRGLAFLGDALAHGVLPGIALAVVWGFSTVIGAMVAAAVMAGLVTFVSSRSSVRDDTGIGLLFVGMLSLGLVIVSKARTPAVTELLFGDVISVTWSDIRVQLIAAAATLLATGLFYRPFIALTFNPLKAQSLGLHPKIAHLVMMMLLALSVVASFRAVGTLLIFGLMVGPPATASLVTRRVPTMMAVSILFSSIAVIAGLTISFHYDTGGGPTMAGLSVAQFFLVLLVVEVWSAVTKPRPTALHP